MKRQEPYLHTNSALGSIYRKRRQSDLVGGAAQTNREEYLKKAQAVCAPSNVGGGFLQLV